MIPEVNANGIVEKENVGEAVAFRIEDPTLVMQTLSNLYSNPKRIVPQEYMCNARDAHREVGKGDVPIHVTLPTPYDMYLKIRDFGPSLSPTRIREVFTVFGASTKRDSNNETGGFGIGAKCAFAYTQGFTVESITEEDGCNTKRVWHVGVNEDGIPEMTCMMESDTDEETGTLLSIPIEENDISDIKRYVAEITEYWPVRPVLHGDAHPYDDNKTIREGEGWSIYPTENGYGHHHYGEPFVIMDGIRYPLNKHDLPDSEHIDKMKNINIALIFETGEIRPAHNRESLKYTEEVKQTISDRMSEAYEALRQEIIDEIEKADNLWDAELIWQGLDKTNIKGIVGKVAWNGFDIGGRSLEMARSSDIRLYKRTDYDDNTLRSTSQDYLTVGEETLFVVNNEESSRPRPGRLRRIFEETDYETIQVLMVYSDEAQEVLDKQGLEHYNATDITDFEPLKKPKGQRSNTPVSKCYAHCGYGGRGTWRSTEKDLASDEIVWVEIYRNDILDANMNNHYRISDLRNKLGLTLIGVPTRFVDKVKKNPNATHFNDWMTQQYEEAKAKADIHMGWKLDEWKAREYRPNNQDQTIASAVGEYLPKDHWINMWIRISDVVERYTPHADIANFANVCEWLQVPNPFKNQDANPSILSQCNKRWDKLMGKAPLVGNCSGNLFYDKDKDSVLWTHALEYILPLIDKMDQEPEEEEPEASVEDEEEGDDEE